MTELDALNIISGQIETLTQILTPCYNASLMIIQYGQVFVPLIIIIIGLWGYLSQFMTRYR